MIRLDDYEESEDLTADMVRVWLREEGWILMPPERTATWNAHDAHSTWEHSTAGACVVVYERAYLLHTIASLASHAKRSPQSLLREINPRMRAGWPSEEEIQRHAFWMVRTLSDDGIRVLGAYVAREWKKAGIKVECWPCDQHGNKTRRGA